MIWKAQHLNVLSFFFAPNDGTLDHHSQRMQEQSEQHIKLFVQYIRIERRMSEKTVQAYELDIVRFAEFVEGEFEIPLLHAERGHVKRYIVWRGKRHHVPRSINRSLSALRTFYKWALREKLIPVSPLDGVRSLKTPKKLVMSIPENDLQHLTNDDAFSEDFTGIRDQLMLILLYGLGIRKAELINLKTSDFDWSRNEVRVVGKRSKERRIPIPHAVKPYFDKYLIPRSIVAQKNDQTLFLTEKGKKLYPQLVYKKVLQYLNATTKVVNKNPHALRHSYATHLLNSGVDINTVKELLGHESLSSTQVYTTSTFEELVKVYNRTHPKGS